MKLDLVKAQGGLDGPAQSMSLFCACHEIAEWTFQSARERADPFGEITLDALISDARGRSFRVPAFWAGGREWRVRFAPPEVGRYALRTVCSDSDDPGLHAREGELEAAPYTGDNPLLKHGPLRMAQDGRHLAHDDGVPFMWLSDTWWLGLTDRLDWPSGFQQAVADRREKGFTVIQMLVGLPCDMPAHDLRGANEGGLAWEPGYARINPAFFDWADLRIDWLVAEGLVPCLFGSWSFYLLWMGPERMRQHWRYLIARYGAYPLTWCLAGGGTMPYYVSEDREGDQEALRQGWAQMAQYVAICDPYRRPLVVDTSPLAEAIRELQASSPCDLPMRHVRSLVRQLSEQHQRTETPQQPAPLDYVGQICQPGMLQTERHELHRILFWTCMLSQACGYTYGVNGMWQFNTPGRLFGPSPTGRSWPAVLWEEALSLASSRQVGWGRRFLESYRWEAFRSHPEWVEPHAHPLDARLPYAAGIPSEVRVVYFPQWPGAPVRICGLEAGQSYRARFIDPREGHEFALGSTGGQSQWDVPLPPGEQDWLLVMERDDR